MVNAFPVFRAWQLYNKCRVEGNNHPLVSGSAPAQYLSAFFGARALLAQAHLAAHLFLHRGATSQEDQPAQVPEAFPFQEQEFAFVLEFHEVGPFILLSCLHPSEWPVLKSIH